MRQAARDAIVLLAIGAVLFIYRLHVDPAVGTAKHAIDWRYHFVWLHPLLVVAFAPLIFHPYIVSGRDLPRRSRTSRASPAAARIAAESPEWAGARRQGAA
jgi:hypothetical protein